MSGDSFFKPCDLLSVSGLASGARLRMAWNDPIPAGEHRDDDDDLDDDLDDDELDVDDLDDLTDDDGHPHDDDDDDDLDDDARLGGLRA